MKACLHCLTQSNIVMLFQTIFRTRLKVEQRMTIILNRIGIILGELR